MTIESFVRDNIKALKPYTSAREEFTNFSSDLVFLDANESPFNNGTNRYPDPQQESLKSHLSQYKSIPAANILFGNGSDEVLDLIVRVFCEPNKDEILILPPTYGMYEVLANTNAVGVQKVALDQNFQPDVEAILSASNSNTKLLFLCSPNNPTANSLSAKRIEKLVNNFNGIVVIDEAYIDFSKEDSWIYRLDQFSNLIVTQTFSKAYGMAGIRLGVCYASKYIISVLNKIKPPYNVNALTQTKAIERLLNVDNITQDIQGVLNEKVTLITALNDISFVEKIYPSDTNFILVKVDDAPKRYAQLIKKGIVVRNRTNQIGCSNCIRITIGTSKENNRLINTLKDIQEWERKYSL